MKIVNSFIKGLDKDTSFNKNRKETLFHNENFRILTQGDATNSNLSIVLGNDLINCTNDYKHSSFSIIGHSIVRDDIVLFWAQNTAINTDSYTTYSYIDLLKRNPNGSYTKILLWYGQGLNLRTDKPIESVSRYETPSVIKIYWTDNNEQLRFANIAPDLDSNGVVKNAFDDSNYTRIRAYSSEKFNRVAPANLS